MKGLDYAWTHVPAPAVKAAGFGWVGRYLSHDLTKALSAAEARGLLAESVSIVLVWEDAAQAALRGHAGGAADAQEADKQATACGLKGAVIYFAADWDAAPADQALIDAYLDGAASVIGRARTGLYGGYWPLSRAKAAGKAAWFWGTAAWSGTNWADHAATFTPHIMQGTQVTVAGVSVDLDEALIRDFGQWPRPVITPKPPPPKPPLPVLDGVLVQLPAGTSRIVLSHDGGKTWM